MFFLIGIAVIIAFIIGTKGIFLLVPGFALKMILFAGLGFGCFFFMMWLFPNFTINGTRKEVESDIIDLKDSVSDLGKSVEFDLFGDYRKNKWLKAQKAKKESGFYKDNNGLKYYNATQDKFYYQLPDERWQEYDTWGTPVNDPFDKPAWRSITNKDDITGFWKGSNNINFPEVVNLAPAFSAMFTMTLRRNNDLFDVEFKLDLENFLDSVLAKYPDYFESKDIFWTTFTENSKKQTSNIKYGKYYITSFVEKTSFENILKTCKLEINNNGTKINVVMINDIFGIEGANTLACILDKQ